VHRSNELQQGWLLEEIVRIGWAQAMVAIDLEYSLLIVERTTFERGFVTGAAHRQRSVAPRPDDEQVARRLGVGGCCRRVETELAPAPHVEIWALPAK